MLSFFSLVKKSQMTNLKWGYFIVLWGLTFTAIAQKNGAIYSRETVVFPEYSTLKDIAWYYAEEQYQSSISSTEVLYEKLTYFSDGLKVIAYLSRPALPVGDKYPVVIFNRGSYIRNDICFVHAPLFKMLVKNGFIVIAPALRESEGGEGKDELGGSELADIMNIQGTMKEIKSADVDNVFMLGESRGGMMTFQAIKNKYPLRAAVTIGAITDMNAYIADQKWEEKTLIGLWSDYDIHKNKIIEQRSVLSWYEEINVPLLILHGAKDPQVKPDHALWLAQKLTSAGKSFQLMIVSDGNHILSGSSTEERDRQIVSWFKKFIK
jgi:dipeptidyl aminopeptidase/acylaminoacyl peptidase